MNTMTLMAILLFVLAFLIGFFLIYLLRRKSTEERYQERIATLEEERAQKLQQLGHAEQKMHTLRKSHKAVAERLRKTEDIFHQREEEVSELMRKIDALEEERETLLHKIGQEEQEISVRKSDVERLTKELEEYNEVRGRLKALKSQVDTLKEKLFDQKALISSYKAEIEKLKELRKNYREEAKAIDDQIFDTKAALHQTSQEIGKIEKQYAKPIEEAQAQSEELKILALNYRYAVREYERRPADTVRIEDKLVQKLFKTPDSTSGEIDSLIQKSEGKRLIDRIAGKLFKKRLPNEEL